VVLGEIPVSCRGDWIVENKILKKPEVNVVRAVVVPQNGHIPMRMLNLQPYPVILHKGTKVATAEECILCSGVSTQDNTEGLNCSEKERKVALSCILDRSSY